MLKVKESLSSNIEKNGTKIKISLNYLEDK